MKCERLFVCASKKRFDEESHKQLATMLKSEVAVLLGTAVRKLKDSAPKVEAVCTSETFDRWFLLNPEKVNKFTTMQLDIH